MLAKFDRAEVEKLDGIPVRNLWLLLLYASSLYRQRAPQFVDVERNPEEIADLVAELLCHQVESRLRRALNKKYEPRSSNLSRVRGRIDSLYTESHQLLAKGLVRCKYEELSVDTPRNRFVLLALGHVAPLVRRQSLMSQCHQLKNRLISAGVQFQGALSYKISNDQFGRHDADDLLMVSAAELAMNLSIPTRQSGGHKLVSPEQNSHWLRNLFEKAVAGFYKISLAGTDWKVSSGRPLKWQIDESTSRIDNLLPHMRTDIILENVERRERLVIDTKFTAVLKAGYHRSEAFSSRYLYQMYAYLHSQKNEDDPLSLYAKGVLLHPAIDEHVDESVSIQGNEIQFFTVDLGGASEEIREQLTGLVQLQ